MDVYLKDYGIESNSRLIQTEKLQKAIDVCSESGGGYVVFEEGTYLTGTLHIKDNVIVWVKKNALILGSTDIRDYPDNQSSFIDAVGHKRGKTLFIAYRNKNIGIVGEGMIDGRGSAFPADHRDHLIRPFLIRMVESENVLIKCLKLHNAAAWCLHVLDCTDVSIEEVNIVNRCNANNDGIDIDGSENVTVKDCYVSSGDDAICLKSTSNRTCRNIEIRGCKVSSDWAAFKIGTESVGNFENIKITNCYFYDVEGCGIKIVPVDGALVNNVQIDDIRMINCTGPIFISSGERLREYFGVKKTIPGRIEKLSISNIYADVKVAKERIYQSKLWGNSVGSIVISGIQNYNLQDIRISDCFFAMPGGIEHYINTEVPEMGKQYPEFHLFDILPSYAFYIRHVDNISIKNTTVQLKRPDCRLPIVSEDTMNLYTEGDILGE